MHVHTAYPSHPLPCDTKDKQNRSKSLFCWPAMHTFNAPQMHLPAHARARARTAGARVQWGSRNKTLQYVANGHGLSAKRAVRCTRRSVTPQRTRMRQSQQGLAISLLLYCLCVRPCVRMCVCVCILRHFIVCWNCALMDEKEKLTNLPIQWFPAIHYHVLYMLCNIEMNLFGYIQSIFSVIILTYFAKAGGLAVNFSADVFSPAGWKSAVALLLWRNSFCPQMPTNTSLIKVVRAA